MSLLRGTKKKSGRGGSMRAAAFGVLALASCTNAELQAIDDVDINLVDNLLEVGGTVCTDKPKETDFPVKILFIIDGSGSMQFIDAPAKRALAVEEAILRLRSNPSVKFAVIRFNEADVVLTLPNVQITAADPLGVDLSNAFTNDPSVLQSAVQGLRVADSVTDYQGALSTAYKVLADDMISVAPAELARTKYVIIFLSDGDPFPDCCSAMNNNCDASRNLPFCSDPELIRTNPTQLPFVQAGEDYNQPYQIYAAVRDIMQLGATFGAGEMRLHTGFLFDPSLVTALNPDGTYTIGGVVFVNVPEARMLLGTMAMIGQGVFRDFSRSEEIDFLGFDLTSIKRENALKNLIVTNSNLIPTQQGLVVDSDADGLPDNLEFEAGLNRLSRDSDGDGFSDTLEWARRKSGLDPLFPSPGCEDPEDREDGPDADGLATCEEVLLGTSVDLPDTDADGVPDPLELREGTNPARSDALSDADLDGVRNGDEIRSHTGVSFEEDTKRPELAYRYRTDDIGVNEQGERCYDFLVKNVKLGTPLARMGEDASYGRNDLFVYMAQAPFDDPNDFGDYKVACVRARYIAPDFKDPPLGKVELRADDFKALPDLNLGQDCVGLTPPSGAMRP